MGDFKRKSYLHILSKKWPLCPPLPPKKDDKAYISWRKPEDIQDHDDGDEAALRDGGRADGRERGRHADRHQAPDRQVLETPELENNEK